MSPKQKKLKIASLESNLFQIEKYVEEICDEYNINTNYYGNILLVLTEAVKNAIIHGNSSDVNKYVNINFESKPFGLSFIVSDEGDGFDYKTIKDPTDPLNDYRENGAGIFLIHSLSDEVNFSNNGKTIEMIFKIASINYELAIKRVNALKLYFSVTQKETA